MTTVTENQTDWQQLAPGVEVLLRPDASNEIVALIVFTPFGSAVESARDAGTVTMATSGSGRKRISQ